MGASRVGERRWIGTVVMTESASRADLPCQVASREHHIRTSCAVLALTCILGAILPIPRCSPSSKKAFAVQ
eukprot:1391165-Pyramimonas_sp.AAC.1